MVDTGVRTTNGATLAYINSNFEIIEKPDISFFNEHPSYQFVDSQVGSDYFVNIPSQAYWKRGTVPSGKTYAGNWYMMLSSEPKEGFNRNPYVFKNTSGQWMDYLQYR